MSTSQSSSTSKRLPFRARVNQWLENNSRLWMGSDLLTWARMLVANRFAIDWRRTHIAIAITIFSTLNLVLRIVNRVVLGRRCAKVAARVRPVFIIGHWRSGTTMLHEFMTEDPRNIFPSNWDCVAPQLSYWLSSKWTRFIPLRIPSSRPFDNVTLTWQKPQEDEIALCNLGARSPYYRVAFPNCNREVAPFLDLAKRPRIAPYLKPFLSRLVMKSGAEQDQDVHHVILKSPTHTWRVDELRKAFPDATFIHITRDPYEVFPSTRNLWKRLCGHQGMHVPSFDRDEDHSLDQFVLDVFADMHATVEDSVQRWKEEDADFDKRYVRISYESIDPTRPENTPDKVLSILRDIYGRLDIHAPDPLPADIEQRLRTLIEAKSRYRKNAFKDLTDLEIESINSQWQDYFLANGYRKRGEASNLEGTKRLGT